MCILGKIYKKNGFYLAFLMIFEEKEDK